MIQLHQPPSQALVDVGAQIGSILHHMTNYPSANDADSPVLVLRRLLGDTFEDELHRDADDLLTAAAVLADAGKAIEENIFLVPPSPPPPQSREGGRRRRRRPRR